MVDFDISPIVETERLALRAPAPRDAERLAMLANDIDIARMTTSIPHPYGVDDARGFLEQISRNDPGQHAHFALEAKDGDGGLIGMIGFHPMEDGRTQLGYWLGRAYWGKGLATEAARAALKWATQEWRRRFIMARHFTDNPASGEVLCKAGFLYTGEVTLAQSRARSGRTPSRTLVWLA
jgi:RimJ/RimL family protein N-acetyltransferase